MSVKAGRDSGSTIGRILLLRGRLSRRRGCGEPDIEQPGAPVSPRPLCVFVPLWCNARRGPLRPTLVSVLRGRPSLLLQELPDCRRGDAGGEARAVGHPRDLLLGVIDDADGVRGLGIDYPRELPGAAQEDGGSAVAATGVGVVCYIVCKMVSRLSGRREDIDWPWGLVECSCV